MRRWFAVSILTFSFTFGSTVFFREVLGLAAELSFFITLTLTIVGGFLLCRSYVYRAQDGSIVAQFLKYLSSVSVFRILDFILFVLLVRVAQLWYPLAMAIILPSTAILKFITMKKLVFADEPAQPRAKGANGH
ncbi:MAG: GtrA family protein [Limisphaerales bacterium]